MAACDRTAPRRSRGATLLEVLVSLLITVVGLLGLAAMQAYAHQAEFESYQRAQALVLLYDMVDRINANRRSAGCFAFTTDTSNGTPFVGDNSSGTHLGTASCASGFENSLTKAIVDAAVNDWNALLQGSSETKAGAKVGAMIGARGCVSYDSTNKVYTVAVSWQGLTDLFEPTVHCGKGLYGAETKRRTVWVKVKIATLS
jgi:type IV pilus assembly protein PilV